MPIHFLWGDEDFLIEKRAREIREKALSQGVNELNYRSYDNPSFPLFSELVRTNAMMFGDTVIQIKCQKYFLESKTKEKLDDNQVKELVEGFNNLSNKVHLILICPIPKGEKKKPDSRKKLYKELIKLTQPEEFKSFRNYEINKIIPVVKKMASDIKIKINTSEITFLIQTTGTSLRDINNQLEKLKLFAYPNDLITSDMVKKVANSNVDITTAVDYILSKNYIKALDIISEAIQKDHYLSSLALIQTTISNLLRTKIYSKTMNSSEIARKLNQLEFIAGKNVEKLSKISEEFLINLKINLLKAEFCLKTGILKDPITAYEMAFAGNFEGIEL